MTIRLRLALLFAAVAVVAGAVLGFVFVTQFSGGLRHSVLTSLQTRTATLLQQFPDTTSTGAQVQQATLGGAGGELADTQDVTQFLEPNGRVIAASGPDAGRPLVGIATVRQAERSPVVRDVRVGRHHTPFLVLVTPTERGGTVVVVGQSMVTVDQAISRVTYAIAVGGSVVVLAMALAAWLVARRALSAVERMRRQAEEISERDSSATLTVPRSRDEIARLATTLNDLLARLHAVLERERGFSAAAGHELRSPLAVLRAELQLAGRAGRSPTYLEQAVRRATGEVDRVIDLADRLLLISQGDEEAVHLERVEVDVRSLVGESVASFTQELRAADISVVVRAPTAAVAAVDALAYRRILDNLIENSIRHGRELHRIDLTVRPDESGVVLEVADDGSGFPPEFLPHAFDRFSRADPSRSRRSGGAGLGLSLVQVLARAHGGTVEARNGENGGGIVTVWVPRRWSPDRTREATKSGGAGRGAGEPESESLAAPVS